MAQPCGAPLQLEQPQGQGGDSPALAAPALWGHRGQGQAVLLWGKGGKIMF